VRLRGAQPDAEGAGVLTLEFKTNLLAPARGEELIARGRVVRAGRTITVCQALVCPAGRWLASRLRGCRFAAEANAAPWQRQAAAWLVPLGFRKWEVYADDR
jgi:acyl-coenzyme A thioesterase PaaI-like protein